MIFIRCNRIKSEIYTFGVQRRSSVADCCDKKKMVVNVADYFDKIKMA